MTPEQRKEVEPILIKAGDKRVLINGEPPMVDCRIVAEERWQAAPDIDWNSLRLRLENSPYFNKSLSVRKLFAWLSAQPEFKTAAQPAPIGIGDKVRIVFTDGAEGEPDVVGIVTRISPPNEYPEIEIDGKDISLTSEGHSSRIEVIEKAQPEPKTLQP